MISEQAVLMMALSAVLTAAGILAFAYEWYGTTVFLAIIAVLVLLGA